MANISDAWGDYHFDFSKTQLNTPALRKAWLEKLSDILMYHTRTNSNGEDVKFQVEYFTELRLDDLSDDDYKEEVTVGFGAAGRWSYQNNMSWFADSKNMEHLYNHMLSADGLVMTVEFEDIEGYQYIRDAHQIIVENGKITHLKDEDAKWENIYPKKYLELGIGDELDAVNHFICADDLTDEQFERILTMSEEEFNNWEEIVGFSYAWG